MITVFSTQTCPWCLKAKEFFSSHNINYDDKDVGVDREAAAEMVRKSGQMGVPVIDINGEVIVGFDEGRIRNLLGISS